ncbi:DUF5989 family protein [Candidatus Pelagibacter sp.]|jgi:hypothetical protein|nr:DUF5989 family protein [Candidatus Pelagibacter sp.]
MKEIKLPTNRNFGTVFFLVLFGGLIILSQGSAVAPFIYTVF